MITRFTPDDAVRAVHHVLAGRTIDNKNELGVRIPFTERAEIRFYVALDIHSLVLCSDLEERYVQPLVLKMLHHYSKSGLQTMEALSLRRTPRMMMDIIDALEREPQLLETNAGIPAIIRKHGTRSR